MIRAYYFVGPKHVLGLFMWSLMASWGSVSLACSSCGNGSSNPIYLYPYENTKVYLGITSQTGFEDITYSGDVSESILLKERHTYTIAFGWRTSRRSFVSAMVSRLWQEGHSSDAVYVTGDSAINFRYALYQQMLTDPWLPQVEVILGYKKAIARGVSETSHPEMLDVGGTGFDDIVVGLDLWSGMTPIQFGGSLIHSFALPEKTQKGKQHPGDTQSLSFSVGKTWPLLKVAFGTVHSRKFLRTWNAEKIAMSDTMRNNAFLTLDGKVAENTLRLSISREAAFGDNKATSRSTAVNVAFMRTF